MPRSGRVALVWSETGSGGSSVHRGWVPDRDSFVVVVTGGNAVLEVVPADHDSERHGGRRVWIARRVRLIDDPQQGRICAESAQLALDLGAPDAGVVLRQFDRGAACVDQFESGVCNRGIEPVGDSEHPKWTEREQIVLPP